MIRLATSEIAMHVVIEYKNTKFKKPNHLVYSLQTKVNSMLVKEVVNTNVVGVLLYLKEEDFDLSMHFINCTEHDKQ